MTQITKTSSTYAQSALAAAPYLRSVMQGNVLLPGDRAYTSARQIWNGAVDHRPASAVGTRWRTRLGRESPASRWPGDRPLWDEGGRGRPTGESGQD